MKTQRKSKILGIVLAAFMALAAFFGIVATLPRSASADSTETVDTSTWIEKEYDGTAIEGRYFRMYASDISKENAVSCWFGTGPVGGSYVHYFTYDSPGINSFDFYDCFTIINETEDFNYVDIYVNKGTITYMDMEGNNQTLSTSEAAFVDHPNNTGIVRELVKPVTDGWQEVEYDNTAPAGRYFKVTPYDRENSFAENYLYLDGSFFSIRVFTSDGVTPKLYFDTNAVDESLYGIEFMDCDYYHFVVYFAEDCKLESFTFTWDATTDNIEQAISEPWNCYTTELIKPASNPSGSGGSSVNPNNTTNNTDELDVFEKIALVLIFAICTIIELICLIKVPNSKAKWIIFAVLAGVFVLTEGALYMYFLGII